MYSSSNFSLFLVGKSKDCFKKITAILLSIFVVFSFTSVLFTTEHAYGESKKQNDAREADSNTKIQEVYKHFDGLHSFIVGNPETGEIYFGDKTTKKVPIASISKLMTYLLVMEAIDNGEISQSGNVVISKEAEETSYSYGVIGLREGMKTPISDLIEAILIPSSNEAAVALACHVSGSEAEFVNLMNKRAKELGLKNTHFYTASGLPTNLEEDENMLPSQYLEIENHSSAEDLFKLASFILKKYPEITKITSKKNITLDQFYFTSRNTNGLVQKDDRVDGLKTGYTSGAGRCLICTRTEEPDFNDGPKNMRTMVVLMGASSVQERDEKIEELLNLGEGFFQARQRHIIAPMSSLKIPGNITPMSPKEKKEENKKSFIIKIVEFAVSIVIAIILLILLLRYIIRRRRRNRRLIMSKKRYRKRSNIKF